MRGANRNPALTDAVACGCAAALALFACDEPRPTSTAAPDVEARIERARDELPEPPSAAWPSDVQSLAESLEAFRSVEACRAHLREHTPVELAEGLADLAYDGIHDDVCGSLDAVKRGSVEACDALSVYTARNGCRRRLALVQGRPAVCPDDPVRPGREAVCLAWAARDVGLCRSASGERATCEAVLTGEAERCAPLASGDRARCRAAVARYATSLGDERTDSPATRERALFELTIVAEGREPEEIRLGTLEHGVRLVARGCRYEVVLAHPLAERGLGSAARGPNARIDLVVPVPTELPLAIPIGAIEAVLAITTAAYGSLTSIGGASGSVTLERFEPRLGGAVAGRVRAVLRRIEGDLTIEGRFASFVRDLEPAPASCEAP